MTQLYIEDENGQVQPVEDAVEWGRRFETADRQVAYTDLGDCGTVTTEFLGIDHRFIDDGPPVLYETFVMGGGLNGRTQRYYTREQALVGHEQMVRVVKFWRIVATSGEFGCDEEE